MKILNGSIELNVTENGLPSAPPILLLHGITSYSGTWDWLVPDLAEHFRVLSLDFRGHGKSDWAAEQYLSSGYISDAVTVLEQVAGQPAIVMGHSLGGATTAALAQRHPELLKAAIMEDPALGLGGSGKPALEGNSLLTSFKLMRESVPRLQASGITVNRLVDILAATPSASGGTFGDILHASGIEQMAESMLKVDASVLDPVLTGNIEAFLNPAMPLAVPSLIVCADPAKPDALASPELANAFADISPVTEVFVVEGAGHLIHDELVSRDTFRKTALDFLHRHGLMS
ncbi:alpha/beta fold hydrolase [uncultured Ilumatobacter sp.]|uniref:alpha/beta fold hydrolase n=1 Tax=uncultured Ilumatobacter sp. TaxID=879968 RepID=UPI00374E7E50